MYNFTGRVDEDSTSGDPGDHSGQRSQPTNVSMFLMCTLIALTRVRSIIHKLIHKEKQYLRDLDTIETVRTYSCKVLSPRRLS